MEIINKTYESYFKGKEFSNALRVNYNLVDNKLFQSRVDYILKIVKSKKVIHLGCVDHIPLVEEKHKMGLLLHDDLVKNTSRCLGIDINEEGIKFFKEQLGYHDVISMNITEDPPNPVILSETWDYLIMGELLEHIDNPVNFLEKIKNKYSQNIKNYIITVPNAFKINNIKNIFKNIEEINTDHRYWFTPYTISKILISAGYSIDEMCLVMLNSPSIRGPIHRFFLKRFPLFRDGIAICGSFLSQILKTKTL